MDGAPRQFVGDVGGQPAVLVEPVNELVDGLLEELVVEAAGVEALEDEELSEVEPESAVELDDDDDEPPRLSVL